MVGPHVAGPEGGSNEHRLSQVRFRRRSLVAAGGSDDGRHQQQGAGTSGAYRLRRAARRLTVAMAWHRGCGGAGTGEAAAGVGSLHGPKRRLSAGAAQVAAGLGSVHGSQRLSRVGAAGRPQDGAPAGSIASLMGPAGTLVLKGLNRVQSCLTASLQVLCGGGTIVPTDSTDLDGRIPDDDTTLHITRELLQGITEGRIPPRALVVLGLEHLKSASPQHGVGRGRRGESSIPPELRKSIAIRASAEWKP
jgi:hypothetical protein